MQVFVASPQAKERIKAEEAAQHQQKVQVLKTFIEREDSEEELVEVRCRSSNAAGPRHLQLAVFAWPEASRSSGCIDVQESEPVWAKPPAL